MSTTAQLPLIANGAIGASLQVYTRPPVALQDGCHLLAWSRRSTTANPVAETERYRALVIQAAALKVPDDACGSKFQRLLQATVHKLADEQFTEWAKADGNIYKSQYDGQAITLDSVLMLWAEQKQREQIKNEDIAVWLKASKTLAALTEKQRAAWMELMPKMAAPSYKALLTAEQAAVAITRIAEEDAESSIGAFLAQRLSNIMNSASAAADAL